MKPISAGLTFAVATVLLAATSPLPASARDGVSVQIGPGGIGVGIGDRDWRRHGRHYDWGPGFYFYKGTYHGDCDWLRRRAQETDSRTWWRRYRQCRNS